MTAMAELGLYDMFDDDSSGNFSESLVNMNEYRLDTLLSTAAHRPANMIVR